MSMAGATPEGIQSYFNEIFTTYEAKYGINPLSLTDYSSRFKNIIVKAFEQTGLPVVVLIDEYDAPLQHSWKTPVHKDCTEVYRTVFAVLKNADEYEKFVFITGITKFTQISLFSVLNNLTNISFLPEYAAICGITEEEITMNFQPELDEMAQCINLKKIGMAVDGVPFFILKLEEVLLFIR